MKSKKYFKKTKRNPTTLLTIFPEYAGKTYRDTHKKTQQGYIDALRESYRHEGLVLYIGAGVSRSIGLPDWKETIRLLTVNMMVQKVQSALAASGKAGTVDYFETIFTLQREVEKEADFDKPILMMARSIKNEFKENLPRILSWSLYRHLKELRRHVFLRNKKKHFSKEPKMPTSSLLDSIIALTRPERQVKGVQAIINYNYDDILEEKLKEEKIKCLTVRSASDHLTSGSLPCFHVHGILPVKSFLSNRQLSSKEIGNFVFSEDEYHEEYSNPYRWSNITQMNWLGRHSGLFIGLSMEDPNLRRLIDVTHKQYPEIQNYAILIRKNKIGRSRNSKQSVLRNLFEEVETNSFKNIGVNVIWVNTYEDVPGILSSICCLEQKDI